MLNRQIKIGNRCIGPNHPPFIIAEMSGNHNQSLERALQIVDSAAAAGAHAIKIQTYRADTMTIQANQKDFLINDPSSLWNGQTLYNLYEQAHTPWEWHKPIFDRCKKNGLIAFSTPFDSTAVDFLESLEVPAYKIASFENTDIPLLKKVASTGKPMIISTGMATLAELSESVEAISKSGCKDFVLLKCTSSYPSTPDNSNILTIPHMADLFNCVVGLSDHTLGIGVSIASVPLGSSVIERHFTLNRADGGVDSAFSLEPSEMKMLVEDSLKAFQALGSISYGPTEKEKNNLRFRRSLYVVKDINEGETINSDNVRAIRPGFGLPTKYLDLVMGKKASKKLLRGTPLDWSLIQ